MYINALNIGYRSFKISGREFEKSGFTQNVQEHARTIKYFEKGAVLSSIKLHLL